METKAGDRIAQLLLLSYFKFKMAPIYRTRGFGSTGKKVFWQTVINDKQPKLKIKLYGIEIGRLLDSGTGYICNFTRILRSQLAP